MTTTTKRGGWAGRLGRAAGWTCGVVLALSVTGCARSLTIHQEARINNAMHINRSVTNQTGEPLELNIVCVFPDDLKQPANEALRPDRALTARDWYARRPQSDAHEAGRFDLPAGQIYRLCDDNQGYGRKIGAALRGADVDKADKVVKGGIAFPWGALHNEQAVIYVFPKFVDASGNVLPVTPAKFAPPGAYAPELEVQIGVTPDRPLNEAQYIKVLSNRKMHGAT